MIRLNNTIKLQAIDKKKLALLTGAAPVLTDVDQYNRYLENHISLNSQETAEAKLLRSLLEDELIQKN